MSKALHKYMEEWGAVEWFLFVLGLFEITLLLILIADKIFPA